MPNDVTTVIKASKKVLDSIVSSEGHVDFNLVIPSFDDGMPNGIPLNAESLAECATKFNFDPNDLMSRFRLNAIIEFDVRDLSDENFEIAIKMLRNIREHGYAHRMDFARAEWGTKWNAYQSEIKDGEVSFETAWSHPVPVLKAISTEFPEEEISVMYADEDTGSNCGKYTIKNGEVLSEDIAPNWSEQGDDEKSKWSEFAMKLIHGQDIKPEDYDLNENWMYEEN